MVTLVAQQRRNARIVIFNKGAIMCPGDPKHPSLFRTKEQTLAMIEALPDNMTQEEAKIIAQDLFGGLFIDVHYNPNPPNGRPPYPYSISNAYLCGGHGNSWKEAMRDNLIGTSRYWKGNDRLYHWKNGAYVLKNGAYRDDQGNAYINGVQVTKENHISLFKLLDTEL
jgi:hypothetical protein